MAEEDTEGVLPALDLHWIWLVSILVTVGIVTAHLLGDKFAEKEHVAKYRYQMGSFGAGLMIALFFLEILPKIALGNTYLDHWVYLLFMLGFVGVHLLETQIYRNTWSSEEREIEHKIFEAIGLAIHGVAIGSVIPLFFEDYGLVEGMFYMIPFFIRGFTIAVSASTVAEDLPREGRKANKIFQNLSPILGVLVGLLLIEHDFYYHIFFAIMMGAILYFFTREILPKGRKMVPKFFALGLALVLILYFVFGE